MRKRALSGATSNYGEVFAVLKDLALDLAWSWNHSVHLLWKQLDPELWDRTRNPLLVLETVSRERLLRIASTREFKECLRNVLVQHQTEGLLRDAEQLYHLLEQEVKPAFYERDSSGIPTAWVARMRASMTTLTPMFSAYRTVGEYLEQYYKPAAQGYGRRAADGGLVAKQLAEWLRRTEDAWSSVAILSRHSVLHDGLGPDSLWEITAQVHLGALTPNDVLVELFADNHGAAPFRQRMSLDTSIGDSNSTYTFKERASAARSASDYTVRVVPCHTEVQVPLEANRILWEK